MGRQFKTHVRNGGLQMDSSDYSSSEHSDLLSSLGSYLVTIPAPLAVLEYLTIDVLRPWNPRAAWIAYPQDSGLFQLEASFGSFDTQSFETNPPAIWGGHPMALALESDTGVVTPASGKDETGLAFTNGHVHHIITCSTYPTGRMRFIMGVGCAGQESGAHECRQQLVRIQPLMSVYLSFMHDRRELAADGSRSKGSTGPAAALTPRQLTILRLLSENMKNREIAFTIGYSESTVRIETIEIYQKLGVNGRHEAVRLAARLGLLDEALAAGAIQHAGANQG